MKLPSFCNLAVAAFMLLLGMMFLFPSAYKIYHYCIFRYKSISVVGVISDPMRGRDIGGRPFVSYQDLNGKVFEKRSEAKTHWFYAPKKGEKVRVYFLGNDPQRAIVDSISYYIVFPILLSAMGAAAIFYALKNCWKEPKDSSNGSSG